MAEEQTSALPQRLHSAIVSTYKEPFTAVLGTQREAVRLLENKIVEFPVYETFYSSLVCSTPSIVLLFPKQSIYDMQKLNAYPEEMLVIIL